MLWSYFLLSYLFVFTNQDFETCLINPGSGKNTTRYLVLLGTEVQIFDEVIKIYSYYKIETTYYIILHNFQTRPLISLVVPGLCIQSDVNCFLHKKLSTPEEPWAVEKMCSQPHLVHWHLKSELNFQCLKGQTLYSFDCFDILTLVEHLWNKVGKSLNILHLAIFCMKTRMLFYRSVFRGLLQDKEKQVSN